MRLPERGWCREELKSWLLVQGVISGVTQRFATQAGDLLENLRKTESSLKRLKKSRAGDASADGPGALSDADKVNVQLFLDAQVRRIICYLCISARVLMTGRH